MNKFTKLILTCLCLGIATTSSMPVFAAKKKTKAHHISKNKTSKDNKELAEERRLKRECKGQVNAGACLGYTR